MPHYMHKDSIRTSSIGSHLGGRGEAGGCLPPWKIKYLPLLDIHTCTYIHMYMYMNNHVHRYMQACSGVGLCTHPYLFAPQYSQPSQCCPL